MSKIPESIFTRHRGFFFDKAAATPWRLRIKKAATYAGLVWLVMAVGVILCRYIFDPFDRPMIVVLARGSLATPLLFGIFIYCYSRADSTKRLYDQKGQKDEKKT